MCVSMAVMRVLEEEFGFDTKKLYKFFCWTFSWENIPP